MKKAILYMALALPLGMTLNACDKDSEETKEPRFCRNYKDLVKVNVFYNGSCNDRKTQGTQTYPTLITIPEVEEPKTPPAQVVKKTSIHCHLNLLKEVVETPDLIIGDFIKLDPIDVCCGDKPSKLFAAAIAQKLEIDRALIKLRDHAHSQAAGLNTLQVLLKLADPERRVFSNLHEEIRKEHKFYSDVNETCFDDVKRPLEAIIDMRNSCMDQAKAFDNVEEQIAPDTKMRSKKHRKCLNNQALVTIRELMENDRNQLNSTTTSNTKAQIALYNENMNSVEHALANLNRHDNATKQLHAKLLSKIKVTMAAEEGKEDMQVVEEAAKVENTTQLKKRRAKAAEAQMNLK